MLDFNDVTPVQPRERFDLDEIVRRLRDTAHLWVPQHFPNGRREGDEWRLANIHGDAPRKNGSCVIALKGPHAGDWYDHDGGAGGGPLSALENSDGLLTDRDLYRLRRRRRRLDCRCARPPRSPAAIEGEGQPAGNRHHPFPRGADRWHACRNILAFAWAGRSAMRRSAFPPRPYPLGDESRLACAHRRRAQLQERNPRFASHLSSARWRREGRHTESKEDAGQGLRGRGAFGPDSATTDGSASAKASRLGSRS